MSITYLKRAEIDVVKWNRCVNSQSITSTVFAQHWFLDEHCKRWDAIVVDDYRAVLPLPVRRKFGINYVYPPFFAPRLGFFGEKLMQKEIDEALNCVAEKFKWVDKTFDSDIHYNKGNSFSLQTYLLDLNADYETIRKGYHENHRRNCKKRQKENLELVFDADPKEIINLFRSNRGKEAYVPYKEQDYNDLLHIISLLQERKTVEIVGIRSSDGELCAGAFFPFWGEKYYFLFSGRNADKESGSLFFLMDNFIARHAGERMSLDFNGSSNPHIARFYAGFGAKKTIFTQLVINQLNFLQKMGIFLKRKRKKTIT